jgi:hypothetical protein
MKRWFTTIAIPTVALAARNATDATGETYNAVDIFSIMAA